MKSYQPSIHFPSRRPTYLPAALHQLHCFNHFNLWLFDYYYIIIIIVLKNSLPTTTTMCKVQSEEMSMKPRFVYHRGVDCLIGSWWYFFRCLVRFFENLHFYFICYRYLQNNNKHDAITTCVALLNTKYQEQHKKWGCMRVILLIIHQ